MMNQTKPRIDHGILWPSLVVVAVVTILLAANRESVGPVLERLLDWTTSSLDWLFLWTTAGIFCLLLWLAFGRYGRVKLGDSDDQPEFSSFSWGAMLFCAGMGTSIMYWSIMEPMYYYAGPPFGVEPESAEAADWAVTYGLFHWGISAWTLYVLPTVVIAYSFFVRKQPSLRISTACSGVLGSYTNAWPGKVIDILIIWSLVGGLGTSLGLGVPMVSAVLGEIFGLGESLSLSIMIIVIWVIIYSLSAYLGLHKGIRRLSNINVYLALAIALFVFLAGPTLFILSNFTNSFGLMLQNLVHMSFYTDAAGEGGFSQDWTVFYWAWFVATAPFIGLFVARISKGRSLRELIGGVLLWGSLGSWLYFAVFGGYALNLQLENIAPITQILSEQGGPPVVVEVLTSLPLSFIVLPFFALLAFIFLATSLDSASYVLSAIATRELRGNAEPARWHRLLWGGVLAAVAISLISIGGLSTVQTSAVLVSVPVVFIYGLLTVSLLRWLKADHGEPGIGHAETSTDRGEETAKS